MKKKILAVTLALSTVTVSAFAEQPEAENYRKILQSGKYYLEYELPYVKKILAVEDNKRMDYTVFKNNPNSALFALGFINPLFAVAGLFGGGDKKIPSTYYQEGKFYQFESKKEAKMALWNQLNDPNLDPLEGWNTVKQKLALPEEFTIFASNDMFAERLNGETTPVFVESGNASIKKKEYIYDKYTSTVKSKSGSILFSKNYFFYYLQGELKFIKTSLFDSMNGERIVNDIEIKKLTQEIPDNIIKIPSGCKVYAAGIGDMDDLLDKKVLVEDYTEKGEAEDDEE